MVAPLAKLRLTQDRIHPEADGKVGAARGGVEVAAEEQKAGATKARNGLCLEGVGPIHRSRSPRPRTARGYRGIARRPPEVTEISEIREAGRRGGASDTLNA